MPLFSSVDKIRTDSGFLMNSNIPDEVFESYQTEANAHIISIVASRYKIEGGINSLVDGDPGKIALALIEKLLTSGMILNKEFSGDESSESSDGTMRIERADNMLSQILKWELRLLLANGSEVPQLSTNGVSGWSRLVETNFDTKDFPENPQW